MPTLNGSKLGNLIEGLAIELSIGRFVETGTFKGETARWAAGRFREVVTIELSQSLHLEAAASLADLPNVRCLQGDSAECIAEAAPLGGAPSVFWLDAHYSFDGTAGESAECPLLEELAVLEGRNGDVVAVDDAHMFLMPPPSPHNAAHWPDLPEVIDALRRVVPEGYVFCFENALVAVPGWVRETVIRRIRGEAVVRAPVRARQERLLDELRGSVKIGARAPLRLHLGCGATILEGYVNVDHPQRHHNVMTVRPDVGIDLLSLDLPAASVDEVRLHHVFEHFSRVQALALLIRWQRWLKPGGVLRLETPDLEGNLRRFLSSSEEPLRSAIVRHMVGDQAANWGYHLDQWWPGRFDRTLRELGFETVSVESIAWPNWPYLASIDVTARKGGERTLAEQLAAADRILWDSTVADVEVPTYDAWRRQLRALLGAGALASPGTPPVPARIAEAAPVPVSDVLAVLGRGAADIDDDELLDANARARDRWVRERAAQILPGSRVLDVGAGTCPYRRDFSHCEYVTQDFRGYEGLLDGREGRYGSIDVVSDIHSIPLPDASFDAVLCTEVLEHLAEPIAALREMARLLRHGGQLILTAPLGSGLHQMPHHYYGGFTPEWYRLFLPQAGLRLTEISPNGGFFKLLAQECVRARYLIPDAFESSPDDRAALHRLLGDALPRYLMRLDSLHPIHEFTIGFHVVAVREGTGRG